MPPHFFQKGETGHEESLFEGSEDRTWMRRRGLWPLESCIFFGKTHMSRLESENWLSDNVDVSEEGLLVF